MSPYFPIPTLPLPRGEKREKMICFDTWNVLKPADTDSLLLFHAAAWGSDEPKERDPDSWEHSQVKWLCAIPHPCWYPPKDEIPEYC